MTKSKKKMMKNLKSKSSPELAGGFEQNCSDFNQLNKEFTSESDLTRS